MSADMNLLCIVRSTPIRHAMEKIDSNAKGIVLVVDENRRLLGTVTDGDIRRAILVRQDLEEPIGNLLDRKKKHHSQQPVTAPVEMERGKLLLIMQEHMVRQLPLLDEHGCVVDLVTQDDLIPEAELPIRAVIMAGGFGKRLLHLTEKMPKPMLPVGEAPLIERTVEQLREAGIRRLHITTHYCADQIIDHFGDGSRFGVEVKYVTEDKPLGTAGFLGLMEKSQQPLLVINGDILTGVDFRSMLDYHEEHRADMTVGVRAYNLNVPYGVIESDGSVVRGVVEKPSLDLFINAGIYVLEPTIHRYLPASDRFDMTDVIRRLLELGRHVVSFPIHEYWLDIGKPADYERAQEDIKNGSLVS
jgi:dTDP-glucose pyrophosphorylase